MSIMACQLSRLTTGVPLVFGGESTTAATEINPSILYCNISDAAFSRSLETGSCPSRSAHLHGDVRECWFHSLLLQCCACRPPARAFGAVGKPTASHERSGCARFEKAAC